MNNHFDTPNGTLPDLDALCARQRLARDHAAFFPTRLALARWRAGCGMPALQPEAACPRADWFDRIQRDHQAWLDRGGFAQHETPSPLRQPTMWQPPVAAPNLVLATAPHTPIAVLAQPRPAEDDDALRYGACN